MGSGQVAGAPSRIAAAARWASTLPTRGMAAPGTVAKDAMAVGPRSLASSAASPLGPFTDGAVVAGAVEPPEGVAEPVAEDGRVDGGVAGAVPVVVLVAEGLAVAVSSTLRGTPSLSSSDSRTPVGIRTPNLLIRSQMLYPLSYGRMPRRVEAPTRTARG